MSNKIKTIIGVIIVIIISVIVLILFNTKTEDGTMLNFVGKDYKQAQFVAEQYNLDFNINWEDNSQDEGIVLAQNIKEGTVVKEHDNFIITVSKGTN